MTFYEQELRKIVGEQYPDATYVGRACYVRLSDMNRAKIQFVTGIVANQYNALQMTILNRSVSGKSTTFAFKNNPYSTYDRPTHFTPIWYPDGSYTPYTWLLDCWTPTGMLSMNLADSVRIAGDLWEEWHIAPSK